MRQKHSQPEAKAQPARGKSTASLKRGPKPEIPKIAAACAIPLPSGFTLAGTDDMNLWNRPLAHTQPGSWPGVVPSTPRSIFSGILISGLLSLAAIPTGVTMAAEDPLVAIETNKGRIVLKLNAEAAPETVANFLRYVDEGFYDGTIFHRVIPGFMIQGGGFDTDMRQKTTHAPIQNEADNGLSNGLGTIAMARTSDPHSATAQFFINVSNNTFLNHSSKTSQGWGYTVFGSVVEGMSVVDEIVGVRTTTVGFHQDVPVETVVLQTVTRASDSDQEARPGEGS